MPDGDVLRLSYGDGVSALDRTMRAITMIADGAIGHLLSLGWRRGSVSLEVDQTDPLPCYVRLRKRRVFEIKAVKYEDGRIVIQGEWIDSVSPPGIIDRFMGW